MVVDEKLKLYVANGTGVDVIPPGATAPTFTYPAYDATGVDLDG